MKAADHSIERLRFGDELNDTRMKPLDDEQKKSALAVAEELDADWSQVRAELEPADVTSFAHTLGPFQTTGGSTAMSNSFLQMRRAGATARAMLVEAAAAQWGVPATSIEVERSRVREKGGSRSARFGELVDAASKLAPPNARVASAMPSRC